AVNGFGGRGGQNVFVRCKFDEAVSINSTAITYLLEDIFTTAVTLNSTGATILIGGLAESGTGGNDIAIQGSQGLVLLDGNTLIAGLGVFDQTASTGTNYRGS